MDSAERERRVAAVVHTALMASLGIYVILLFFLRAEVTSGARPRITGYGVFLAFAAVGVAQFAAATAFGRALLRSRRGGAADRVRRYFLLRGAAAEAIALYGFALGFVGAPRIQAVALIVMGAVALLSAFPSRSAWDEAMRAAGSEPPAA